MQPSLDKLVDMKSILDVTVELTDGTGVESVAYPPAGSPAGSSNGGDLCGGWRGSEDQRNLRNISGR